MFLALHIRVKVQTSCVKSIAGLRKGVFLSNILTVATTGIEMSSGSPVGLGVIIENSCLASAAHSSYQEGIDHGDAMTKFDILLKEQTHPPMINVIKVKCLNLPQDAPQNVKNRDLHKEAPQDEHDRKRSPSTAKEPERNLQEQGETGAVLNKLPLAPKTSISTMRAKRNIIKTLILVFIGFIFCWSWSEIYFFLFHIGFIEGDFTGVFYNFTIFMDFVSCCVNPVIYCIQYKQFQRGVKWVMFKKRVFVVD